MCGRPYSPPASLERNWISLFTDMKGDANCFHDRSSETYQLKAHADGQSVSKKRFILPQNNRLPMSGKFLPKKSLVVLT